MFRQIASKYRDNARHMANLPTVVPTLSERVQRMNNEWYTPPEIIEAARTVLGDIDLDPASCDMAQRTVQATTYYSKEDDGLAQQWAGRVWLNPPYSKPLPFIDKLIGSKDVTAAVVLKRCAASPEWAQKLLGWADRICLAKKRVWFIDETGVQRKDSNIDNAFFYRGPKPELFTYEFAKYGHVLVPASAPGCCHVCRQPLDAARSDARFCSNTCRSRHHRKRSAA